LLDGWWRAANYLSVGQIYLLDNPLLREPLRPEHVKPRLLGHWGTTPGLNPVYAHMNRAISKRQLNAIFVTGPGHGGPGLVANTYLEGTYSEIYPHIGRDEDRRANHGNLHVRGYKEGGTTTTPFDMVMLNDLDRFHLVMDVIGRVPGLGSRAGHVRQRMVDERFRHRQYTRDHGEDEPDVRDWTWPY